MPSCRSVDETTDAQDATSVFATERIDVRQFGSVGRVDRLALHGVEPDGFFTVALPEGGLVVREATALALRFDLAESLSMQSDGGWVLSPRAWCADASTFSSLTVQFDAQAVSFEFTSEGFQVVLLDAGLRPICTLPVETLSTGVFGAQFQFLDPVEGPFVAELVPPPGVALSSTVSVSVDVHASVRAETSVVVDAVQHVGGANGPGALDIRARREARVVERESTGGSYANRPAKSPDSSRSPRARSPISRSSRVGDSPHSRTRRR